MQHKIFNRQNFFYEQRLCAFSPLGSSPEGPSSRPEVTENAQSGAEQAVGSPDALNQFGFGLFQKNMNAASNKSGEMSGRVEKAQGFLDTFMQKGTETAAAGVRVAGGVFGSTGEKIGGFLGDTIEQAGRVSLPKSPDPLGAQNSLQTKAQSFVPKVSEVLDGVPSTATSGYEVEQGIESFLSQGGKAPSSGEMGIDTVESLGGEMIPS